MRDVVSIEISDPAVVPYALAQKNIKDEDVIAVTLVPRMVTPGQITFLAYIFLRGEPDPEKAKTVMLAGDEAEDEEKPTVRVRLEVEQYARCTCGHPMCRFNDGTLMHAVLSDPIRTKASKCSRCDCSNPTICPEDAGGSPLG
jgi:hypothetical protein